MAFDKLSPQAKKAIMRGATAGKPTTATVELAAGFNPKNLETSLDSLGASVRGWSEESRVMTLSIDPTKLDALSKLRGVTYVEVGSKLANPGDQPR